MGTMELADAREDIESLHRALAEIMEMAKAIRDLSDTNGERRRWANVVKIAYDALGKPSMADVDKMRGIP